MPWVVKLKESVIEDLRWFGKRDGRKLLSEAEKRLGENPLAETRNLKTLRRNSIAQRELRLLGKYRFLFNVDEKIQEVTIILVGEKRGESLLVRGKEYTEHHESDPAK
jgi:mRNA-degrading endonuclease RelE of RelBE toxin-antitoxin system